MCSSTSYSITCSSHPQVTTSPHAMWVGTLPRYQRMLLLMMRLPKLPQPSARFLFDPCRKRREQKLKIGQHTHATDTYFIYRHDWQCWGRVESLLPSGIGNDSGIPYPPQGPEYPHGDCVIDVHQGFVSKKQLRERQKGGSKHEHSRLSIPDSWKHSQPSLAPVVAARRSKPAMPSR